MSFKPENKYSNENNLQYAYRIIKNNILRMHMIPGEPIDEKEIADALGISRTPVHEAILLLRNERLIDVQPKIRSSVSLIDRHLVLEGAEIRFSIEQLVLKRACGQLSKQMQFFIQENLMRQRFLIENNEYPDANESQFRFHELDDQFHFYFYSAADMEWSWENLSKICSHLNRLRNFNDIESQITDHYRLQLIDEHEKLFRTVVDNTPEALPQLLYDHIIPESHFTDIYEKYGNYFK